MTETIENFPLKRIDGKDESMSDYQGKVLLIVNVASKCGFTPQYEGLERLFARFKNRGFAVLGFPANDFASQEPGTNTEIAQFCTTNFGVDFPVFEKITVVGAQKHPLYASLIKAQPKPTTSTAVQPRLIPGASRRVNATWSRSSDSRPLHANASAR